MSQRAILAGLVAIPLFLACASNDEPSFDITASDTVLEDSGARSVANFASNFNAGASNESGQTFNFNIVNNTNSALFAVAPSIDSDGELTYTPADDANGDRDPVLLFHHLLFFC